ncbi:dynein regulatory complex protein 9 [Eupeodes corollae]|uniref:dynein regulatory complex protein 9 n=1 Tax=Eupeodes corollae TaxID=290404 RepID=UPI002492CF18|nr:dynein regulatory complex protein 9 [Eupeodes corollae]
METFLADAVCSVLSLTLNELFVLSHGKHFRSNPRIFKEKGTNKPGAKLSAEFLNSNLPATTLDEIKINNEIRKLIEIYTRTIEELQNAGTIQSLLTTINQQITKNAYEKEIIKECSSSSSVLKNLKTRLEEFRFEAEEKLLKASDFLNNLKSDWRIISKVNTLEYELVCKWEQTRFTQAMIVGEKEEKRLEKSFATLALKKENEQRVILDFEAFSTTQLNKYRELIEVWKNRYSKELSELLLSIGEKELKIKELNKRYNNHFEIYCQRKMFILEYLEQKIEQDRLHQLQTQRIESAVKIQAWWRGLMVRRCLGPYKKKTKKGKKGKKGK